MSNYLLWKNSFYGSCKSKPFTWMYFANRCSEKLRKIYVKYMCLSLFFNKTADYWTKTTFLWNISNQMLPTIILLKSSLERFQKIPRKHPWTTLVLLMLQTLHLKLYKNATLTMMFSYKFWEFFKTTFSLKTLCDFLWKGCIYFGKMHLQNTSKILPKMCDQCSLYAENYFVNRNSSQTSTFEKLLECFWDIDFSINKE